MKKAMYFMITTILFAGLFLTDRVSVYANVKAKTRTVNIVYDDSGSMAYNGVTSWSQAKYAMEVFAAMMGENDTLNIYPMSSYSYKPDSSQSDSWGKTVSISGSESAESRVKKIEEMNGDNGIYRNTPIQSVIAAGDKLEAEPVDEKWLIILTDGAFDRGMDGSYISASEMQSTILGYAGRDGINVAYVAIGDSAISLKELGSSDSFYPFDVDINSILDTVTKVARTVFNYQSVLVSGDEVYSFSTDIPISKIIVFTQGKGARSEQLLLDGISIPEEPVSVDVQVADDTSFYPQNDDYDIQFADGLTGCLVTYQSEEEDKPYPAGTYSFKSNVSNIGVYLEPGVDIQPILVDGNNEEINLLEDGLTSIEAGEKTVHIRMMNPLTGETIALADSALLEGTEMTLTVTDNNGKTSTYHDNDKLVLGEGLIDVYAKASFRGDVEKSSITKSIDVTPAKLNIHFEETQYKIDVATLKPDKDILFDVTSGGGAALNANELSAISFEVTGGSGIEWTVEETDISGRYKIIPASLDDSSAQLNNQQLTVTCTVIADGAEKKGSGSTALSGAADTEIELMLELKLPDETVGNIDNGEHYMFDPAQRGVREGTPYIKIDVEALNPDGSTRLLSETEWDAGVDGFTFSSRSNENSLMWRIIGIVCRQKLDFDIVKDTEISSYRAYITGSSVARIRPNESELNTVLTIKLPNGLQEKGSSKEIVSVKPLGVLFYVGRMLVIAGFSFIVVAFVIMEIRKKKFDRDMCPNTSAILTKAGVSIKAPMPPQISKRKIKYKIMPPWKAQERDITLKYPGYLDTPITFHCVAAGGSSFVITNPKRFQIIKEKVRFDGAKYDAVIGQPVILNLNSDIIVYVKKGNVSGKLIMSFRKTEK